MAGLGGACERPVARNRPLPRRGGSVGNRAGIDQLLHGRRGRMNPAPAASHLGRRETSRKLNSVMSAFGTKRTFFIASAMSAFGGKVPPHRMAISRQASKDLRLPASRSGWAGTLMAWSRFFVTADFHDAFR